MLMYKIFCYMLLSSLLNPAVLFDKPPVPDYLEPGFIPQDHLPIPKESTTFDNNCVMHLLSKTKLEKNKQIGLLCSQAGGVII